MNADLPLWAVWFDESHAPDGLPVRHRVLFGGRGGGKSWTIAHKLVERALTGPARILCTREFQNSIRDSSKKLLEDVIERLGCGPTGSRFFTITDREIRGQNGSLISLMGLNGKDAAIKSLEGYNLVWIEEAASLGQSSIDALVPTIRAERSELWWSYNPRYRSDPVDRMFRGDTLPPGTIVVEVHATDNPWFPSVLQKDMDYDRSRDPEKHAHIWQGHYLERSEARVFDRWEVRPFDAPADAPVRFGADWGYSIDPTVLVRCFIGRWAGDRGVGEVVADLKGNTLFVDHEAYRVGCSLDDTPALFAGNDLRGRWLNRFAFDGVPGAASHQITADNARPETNDFMRARGFDVVGAIKGPGSVEDGITFLKSFDIVVHPRCRHLIDELAIYSWQTDRQTGVILPKLADKNNHLIDALRYALEGARRAHNSEFTFTSAGRRTMLTGYLEGFDLGPPGGFSY